MNKRSATLIAASLVGVLAVAGAAFAAGITGPTASAASEQTPAAATNPHRSHPHEDRRGPSTGRDIGTRRRSGRPVHGSPSASMSGDDGSHHDNEGRTITVTARTRVRTITVNMGTRVPTITATTMTDAPRSKKKRWSKRAVRATAWTAGAAAFISALGAFGAAADPGRGRSRIDPGSATAEGHHPQDRQADRDRRGGAARARPSRRVGRERLGSRCARSRAGSRTVHGGVLTCRASRTPSAPWAPRSH